MHGFSNGIFHLKKKKKKILRKLWPKRHSPPLRFVSKKLKKKKMEYSVKEVTMCKYVQ